MIVTADHIFPLLSPGVLKNRQLWAWDSCGLGLLGLLAKKHAIWKAGHHKYKCQSHAKQQSKGRSLKSCVLILDRLNKNSLRKNMTLQMNIGIFPK